MSRGALGDGAGAAVADLFAGGAMRGPVGFGTPGRATLGAEDGCDEALAVGVPWAPGDAVLVTRNQTTIATTTTLRQPLQVTPRFWRAIACARLIPRVEATQLTWAAPHQVLMYPCLSGPRQM